MYPQHSTNISASDAGILLAQKLGLSTTIDLATYDPVNSALMGDANAAKVFAAGVQVQNTIVQAAALVGTASGATDAAVYSGSTKGTLMLQVAQTGTKLPGSEVPPKARGTT